jgi:hypothetical protein
LGEDPEIIALHSKFINAMEPKIAKLIKENKLVASKTVYDAMVSSFLLLVSFWIEANQ